MCRRIHFRNYPGPPGTENVCGAGKQPDVHLHQLVVIVPRSPLLQNAPNAVAAIADVLSDAFGV